MKLLLTRNLPADPVARLSAHYQVTCLGETTPRREDLEREIVDTDVLICTITDKIDDALLAKAPCLKFIATFSVGLDHLSVKTLRSRGIRLSHTPDVLTDATAELTWALILACARRLGPAAAFLKEGKFVGLEPGLFLGKGITGKRLGIVGMGRIGRAVASRGIAFGMEVLYSSSHEEVTPFPAQALSLNELFASSDVLSLHCPLTPATRHLVNQERLEKMKPDAILINTARGPIIDERALVHHLTRNPRMSAGLDVFEQEPLVEKPLLSLSNAFCVPHIGSATFEARGQMAEICITEAIHFKRGEPLRFEYLCDNDKGTRV